ncbi:hypothetical protein [Salipiger thiooxidans]|jgi:lysozyme family protein|uniref:hypothetical protein n=1 Tax=Salipiger thiooxidans TaxID=282683 RepID=UPI001CD405B1|nr:hypothetical protein [Salipiger thiooxidans]MCA0851224.1 hypothetical protein [Salipiger thiooxidans]
MSAHPLSALEDLQTRMSRSRSLAKQIQAVALDAQVTDAAEALDMIDALAEALVCRLGAMLTETETLQHTLSPVLEHVTSASSALRANGRDSDQ